MTKKKKKEIRIKKKHLKISGIIAGILVIALVTGLLLNKTEQIIVVLETSLGNIEIELNNKESPITTNNFLEYVNSGFYEGIIFHRVINGFMVQGGGFLPSGSQKQTNAKIKLESNNGLKNTIGTLAMARTQVPDSASSQFFINVADNSFLDYSSENPGYAVFGRVINGMDVVNKIKSVETENRGLFQDWPVENIVIIKAYVK